MDPAVDWLRSNSSKTLEELTANLQRGPIPSVAEYSERQQKRRRLVGPVESLDAILADVETHRLKRSTAPEVQAEENMQSEQSRSYQKPTGPSQQTQAEEPILQTRRGKMEQMIDRLLRRSPVEGTQGKRSRHTQKQRSQEQSQLGSQSHLPHPPQPETEGPSTRPYHPQALTPPSMPSLSTEDPRRLPPPPGFGTPPTLHYPRFPPPPRIRLPPPPGFERPFNVVNPRSPPWPEVGIPMPEHYQLTHSQPEGGSPLTFYSTEQLHMPLNLSPIPPSFPTPNWDEDLTRNPFDSSPPRLTGFQSSRSAVRDALSLASITAPLHSEDTLPPMRAPIDRDRLLQERGSGQQGVRIPDNQASSTIRETPSRESGIISGIRSSKLSL